MKQLLVGLMLLAVSATATADQGWRVGTKLVQVGDSMAEVQRVAGPPDIANRIESEFGGTVGNRWYYEVEGINAKTVIITFEGGRVVSIETERH